MKTQILISINEEGFKNISLIAESEAECKGVMETYHKFESEILDFLCAMRKRAKSDLSMFSIINPQKKRMGGEKDSI